MRPQTAFLLTPNSAPIAVADRPTNHHQLGEAALVLAPPCYAGSVLRGTA